MKLIFKNKVFAFISLSRMFNILGSSIYNIVFVVFASSLPHPKFAVGIANFIVLVPTFFTIFIGMQADKTIQKARWLIHMGYVQAFVFTAVAILTKSSTYIAFSTVCLINILSDTISDYRSGLQMPILKKNIADVDMMEAFSFTQLLTYLCNLAGQALGVWLLTVSNQNFTLVALINALSFLLSSTTLYFVRHRLTHEIVQHEQGKTTPLKQQFKQMYQSSKLIFEQDNSTNFFKLLLQVLILNALGGSIMALYNLYLLDHPLFGLSFSQSLLIFETTFILGVISASLTPNDYFSKLSINKLALWASLTIPILGIINFYHLPVFLGLLVIFFMMYIAGKVNPKINSLLLSKLPSDVLAQTSSFLSLLFSFSIPLGTMIFTSLAIWNMKITWMVFTGCGIISLLLSLRKDRNKARLLSLIL
ncbi:transporter [Streptococcus constellatus]|uniref:transporter n=1 Tax=Streptococcus constellatus TaxID=76860 RepID=UPI00319E28C4